MLFERIIRILKVVAFAVICGVIGYFAAVILGAFIGLDESKYVFSWLAAGFTAVCGAYIAIWAGIDDI